MAKSWRLDDQFPRGFTLNSKDYTVTDSENTISGFTVNDGTSDVKTTASCAGTDGLLPLRGARLTSFLEGVAYAALAESASAVADYTPDLSADTSLVTELAENLKAIFDTMYFDSNLDRS